MHSLSINYEDGDASSYKGIDLEIDGGQVVKLYSGDPIIDYLDMHMIHIRIGGQINLSSSFDNFIMDSEEYTTKYVNLKTVDQRFHTYDELIIMNEFPLMVVAHVDHENFHDVKQHYLDNKEIVVYDLLSSENGKTMDVALTRQYAQRMSSQYVNIGPERVEKLNTDRVYSVDNVNEFVRTYPVYRRQQFKTNKGRYIVPEEVIIADNDDN